MALGRLQVTDLRCLQTVEVDLDPRFTLISGPNASGKTSLLEAIYVLGRGRSFRTRRLDHLIRRGATRFVVFGEVEAAIGACPSASRAASMECAQESRARRRRSRNSPDAAGTNHRSRGS
jgi:recombinational DNA repair ATPase RecF